MSPDWSMCQKYGNLKTMTQKILLKNRLSTILSYILKHSNLWKQQLPLPK